jgi:hypothetical protein
MIKKVMTTTILILVSTSAMADGPVCKVVDESGTIDISDCPVERPWRCYTNYSCENGTEYTIWGMCEQSVQDCW